MVPALLVMVFGGLSEPTLNPSESRQLRGVHASVERKPKAWLFTAAPPASAGSAILPTRQSGTFHPSVVSGPSQRAASKCEIFELPQLRTGRVGPSAPTTPVTQALTVGSLGERQLLAASWPGLTSPAGSSTGSHRNRRRRRGRQTGAERLMVLTADASVEGVHFERPLSSAGISATGRSPST